MVWWKIVAWLFSWYEGWTDRNGEKQKNKITDGLILIVGSSLYVFVAWKKFEMDPLILSTVIVLWRVGTFDYIVNYFLKKYHKDHKDIHIWSYMGNTTKWWDQLISKIPWKLRLVIRALLVILLFVLGEHLY